jgi:hypothetical protein
MVALAPGADIHLGAVTRIVCTFVGDEGDLASPVVGEAAGAHHHSHSVHSSMSSFAAGTGSPSRAGELGTDPSVFSGILRTAPQPATHSADSPPLLKGNPPPAPPIEGLTALGPYGASVDTLSVGIAPSYRPVSPRISPAPSPRSSSPVPLTLPPTAAHTVAPTLPAPSAPQVDPAHGAGRPVSTGAQAASSVDVSDLDDALRYGLYVHVTM